MATETIKINDNQKSTLKAIVAGGKQPMKGKYDTRTVSALENRGLVKRTDNKSGAFVAATAKGRKLVS